jgi:hypothetical protein
MHELRVRSDLRRRGIVAIGDQDFAMMASGTEDGVDLGMN